MSWRRLHAHEVDHELVWFAVSVTGGALGVAWLRMRMPVPPCAFHVLTGCPCPTCGATRAMRQLCDGHLLGAAHYNPLAVCAALGLVVFDLYAALVLAFQLPRFRLERLRPEASRRIRYAAVGIILLNWCYLIWARV